MYEHQTNLSETKAEHMVALKMAQDDHILQENELIKDKRELKRLQKEQDLTHINEIKTLKLVWKKYKISFIIIKYFIYLYLLFLSILFSNMPKKQIS